MYQSLTGSRFPWIYSIIIYYILNEFRLINSHTCQNWTSVLGCSNVNKSSFIAQIFTDNTSEIASFSSFSKITVEGQYGYSTAVIPHCITSKEGITIDHKLISAYLSNRNQTYVNNTVLDSVIGNTIIGNNTSSYEFIDIPSPIIFPFPCKINQYFNTSSNTNHKIMNHAIILEFIHSGNGRICLENSTEKNIITSGAPDVNGNCTKSNVNIYENSMKLTFDEYSVLTEYVVCTDDSSICKCSNNNLACDISCTGEGICRDMNIQCNSGFDCTVNCYGHNACREAIIDANHASSLLVNCEYSHAVCYEINIQCQTTTDGCTLDCSGNELYVYYACKNAYVGCGTGDCLINCTNTGVDSCEYLVVNASISSSYTCSSADTLWCELANVLTGAPTTAMPTDSPSIIPTYIPTNYPSSIPTSDPSVIPTFIPTDSPTTEIPTGFPTELPSLITSSTLHPSYLPSKLPTSDNIISSAPTIFTVISTDSAFAEETLNYTLDEVEGNDSSNDNTILITFISSNMIWIIIATSVFFCCLLLLSTIVYLRKRRRRLYREGMSLQYVYRS